MHLDPTNEGARALVRADQLAKNTNLKGKFMKLISMTIQQQLAMRIATKRKFMTITQAELAVLVGTSQTAIARLEAGMGNPTANLVQRVANSLNMDFTIYVRPQLPEKL